MGLLTLIFITLLIAVVVAIIFTNNSNYLDPNINTTLNLVEKLKLRGTFLPEHIRANNILLRDKLCPWFKLQVIREEQARLNRTYHQNKNNDTHQVDNTSIQ